MTPQVDGELLDTVADQLATPVPLGADQHWQVQSLSRGAAGIALLHIVRARTRSGPWTTAHTWAQAATQHGINAGEDTALYLGAPAIAFMLHTAADHIPTYAAALTTLMPDVTRLAHRRVDSAMARINRGETATFAEYDLFRGLTGIGRLLLERAPGSDALGGVLDYLVRLTQPRHIDGTTLPGWWVSHDPDPKLPTPGGHANIGLAHGISGPLALLAVAMRRGATVDGHVEALERICAFLDTWRHDGETDPWWPQWITRDHLHAGEIHQHGSLRPSWCYGTPGIGRAHQLAALSLGDTTRQRMAEQAIAACLSDPVQLALVSDTGLCHGWAGLYQTAWRAAHDALTPAISTHLPYLADLLTRNVDTEAARADAGLLEGTAGLALALHTATLNAPLLPGWDSCLLIT